MLISLALSAALAAEPALTADPAAEAGSLEPEVWLAPPAGPEAFGIVNGQPAPERDNVLALVAYFEVFGWSFCSSTQIADGAVLTAAHCIDAAEEYLEAGARLYAVRGDTVTGLRDADWFEIDAEAGIFVHPDWAPEENEYIVHDIAVLRTLDPILTDAGPAVLNAEPLEGWIGRELEFVGFGVTGDNAQDGGAKHKTRIPVESTWEEVVLSYDPDTNTCYGDSGGAAFGTGEAIDTLVGVNSFAFTRDGSAFCDGGGNGAARVDTYLEWILSVAPGARSTLDAIEEEPEAPATTPEEEHADCGEPADAEEDYDIPGVVAPHWTCSHTGGAGWLWLLPLPALLFRRR